MTLDLEEEALRATDLLAGRTVRVVSQHRSSWRSRERSPRRDLKLIVVHHYGDVAVQIRPRNRHPGRQQ